MSTFPLQYPRSTRFPSQALAIFIATSLAVLVLEILERGGFISAIVESVARLAIVSVLMAVLIYLARLASLPGLAFFALSLCAICVVVQIALRLADDLTYFDNVPLIGDQSRWKHSLSTVVVACWTCSSFLLLFVLMNRLERREAEQRLANEQLQSALAKIKSRERQIIQKERLAALGQLASGIAHDLNNALLPVVLYADLLRTDKARDPREAVEMIAAGTAHAANIVSQLQHFYKTENPKSQDTIDLSHLIQEAVNLTKPRWHEAIKNGLKIAVDLELGTGCIVRGDPTELKQLVVNLLFNAFDAVSENGNILLRTQLAGKDVILDVVDSGKGMSSDEQAHCFEPFTTSKPLGSGLGLSVCYGIVSRHGGQIRIHNSSKKGTTVRVTLPLTEMELDAAISKPARAKAVGRRILFIDDDESVRHSAAAFLESEGHTVDIFADGEVGLENLRNQSYDIVVTDLGMQGTTGWDVVQRVKSSYPEITVAVVSGWSESQVSMRFEQGHRPDFIIEKPFVGSRIAEILVTKVGPDR